jgi:hypothetical protein
MEKNSPGVLVDMTDSEITDAFPDRIESHENTLGCKKEVVPLSDINTVASDIPTNLVESIENSVQREDRHRELRSMLLSVHPCPPLPQMALGGLNMEERVFSSHDFLATAIDRMFVKKDAMFDAQRRVRQHLLITEHFKTLRKICASAEAGAEIPAELTVVEIPAAEIPVVEIPAAEIPAVEIPAVEIPAAETGAQTSEGAKFTATAIDTESDIIAPFVRLTSASITTPEPTLVSKGVRVILPAFDKLQNQHKSVDTMVEKLYDCFTRFSRDHAIVYFEEDAAHKIDIRFKPLDHICRGDHVHLAACSHLRAYRLMRNVEPLTANEFEDLSYKDVIIAFAKEIVRDDDEVHEINSDGDEVHEINSDGKEIHHYHIKEVNGV